MALTGPQAAAPQQATFENYVEKISLALQDGEDEMAVMNGLESILLSGVAASDPLRTTLWERMPDLQKDDGSFPSVSGQRMIRGLMTAKALALGVFWSD